ncbi:hypothetical protein G6K93_30650 [Agrobacterium rhizogenes]|nr:hypothetical protein [Rhizobium rhizogenes]
MNAEVRIANFINNLISEGFEVTGNQDTSALAINAAVSQLTRHTTVADAAPGREAEILRGDEPASRVEINESDTQKQTDPSAERYAIAPALSSNELMFDSVPADGQPVLASGIEEVNDPDSIGIIGDQNGVAALYWHADGRTTVRGLYNSAGLAGLAHIVNYGQSNAGAADASPPRSGSDQKLGALKFIRGVQTWIDYYNPTTPIARAAGYFTAVPLTEQYDGFGRGETWSTGIAGQIKARSRYGSSQAERGSQLLFTNPTAGGRYLAEISATGPYATYGHYATFLDDITRAKQQATLLGLDYGLTAICYCQGEAESTGLMYSGAPTSNFSAVVSQWSTNLVALRTQMEMDGKAAGGVVRNLPMFVMQTVAFYTGQAQIVATEKDSNIFLASSMYQMPRAINSYLVPTEDPSGRFHGAEIHFSADGQRWMGEMFGKVMRRVLFEGRGWKPLQPISVRRVTNTEIRVKYYVPVGPLRFNTSDIPPLRNYGYILGYGSMDAPGANIAIDSIAINGDEVVLTLNASTPILTGQAAYLKYGIQPLSTVSTQTLTSSAAGGTGPNGRALTNFIFSGDMSSIVTPLLSCGAFYIKSASFSATIRSSSVSAGLTTLSGESAEIVGTLPIGSVVELWWPGGGGNLCDNDDSLSVFNFEDGVSLRNGKPYPLYNFAVIHAGSITT